MAWRKENPSLKNLKDREYHQKHKAEHNEQSKLYYREHQERQKQWQRKYYLEKKSDPKYQEKLKKRTKQQYYKHRHKYQKWHRERWERIRMETLEYLGGAFCKKCGFSDWRALCIDHVNGDGYVDRKNSKISNPQTYLKHIQAKNGKGYQVLCANCNKIKVHENREVRKPKEAPKYF